MEALHYVQQKNDIIKCELCPHECILKPGQKGICQSRKNNNGHMELLNYGIIASSGLDPIEKKPLYHFYPGSKIFSIGGYGCNLRCKFCQNFEISQHTPGNNVKGGTSPEDIVQRATLLNNSLGIAYTYNEPTVFYELMIETAQRAKHIGLKNVMVSNGYISTKPLQELLKVIDAFNIDLKAFTNGFYKQVTGGRLEPVLRSLTEIRRSGRHLEIAFLVIPGLNDSIKECKNMFKWISDNLGEETPLHINRYYPTYKLNKPATPSEELEELYELAHPLLKFVYIGNLYRYGRGTSTYCPTCHVKVIERDGYSTRITNLDTQGFCAKCGHGPIAIMD